MNWIFANFEDDDAADYVESLIARLSRELDSLARRKRLRGTEVLAFCMPRLALLIILNRIVGNTLLPRLGQLLLWRERFFAAFDHDAAKDYEDQAFARKPRRTMDRTFQHLQSLIEDQEGIT